MPNTRDRIGSRELLRLSEKEWKYLEQGELGTFSEKVLDDRVRERRNKLPERFDILFEDIMLLSGMLNRTDDYFDDKEWKRVWARLMHPTLDRENYTSNEEIQSMFEWRNRFRWNPLPHNFAWNLGLMMSRMMIYSDEKDPDETDAEIILGFLEGFRVANLPISEIDGERVEKEVSRMMPHIKEKAKISGDLRKENKEMSFKMMSQRQKHIRDLRSQIAEVIRERFPEEKTFKEWSRKKFKRKFRGEEPPESKYESDIDIHGMEVELVMDKGINEFAESIWNSIKEEDETGITDEQIHSGIDENNIEEKIRFWQSVKKDRNESRIEREEWGGNSAKDVLEILYEEDEIPPKKVARKAKGNTNVPLMRERILPDLSEETDISPWDKRPLVTETVDSTWTLTYYGELLAYHLSLDTSTVDDRAIKETIDNAPENLVEGAKSEIDV